MTFVDRDVSLAVPDADASAAGSLAGLHLLVVEDNALIAMDFEATLQEADATVALAASTAEALDQIAAETCHAAVLDVNLEGETSMPVADELARRAIPFMFLSGHGDASVLPPALRHVQLLTKPISGDRLVAAIAAIAGRRGRAG